MITLTLIAAKVIMNARSQTARETDVSSIEAEYICAVLRAREAGVNAREKIRRDANSRSYF